MESDESLFERLTSGDLTAFDGLYARYERPLFAFVLHQLQDREEAEDVLHEAFLSLVRERSADFQRRESSFRAWLFQVARHLCLNRVRSRDRQRAALRLAPTPVGAPGPDESFTQHEQRAVLLRAVERLPASLSELYQLRIGGLSQQEIAAILEVPVGTVKSRMHELVSQLRKEMKSWTVR
ncbi:MAG: RNA polymerase sigma factor [Myxococcaceae bacterium]